MKKLFFAAMAALGLLASCDKDLDIQQAYSFSLETMPVPKRIGVGETAEIRCTLVREGEYADARYTIRYFQPDGKGELRMTTERYFFPTTAIRWSASRSAFITPPAAMTSRPSTSISRTTWDR